MLLSDGGHEVPAGRNYGGQGRGHGRWRGRGEALVTVIVFTNSPADLSGFLTCWLREVSAGVFIDPSARIRDVLQDEAQQYADQGRALRAHRRTTNKASPSGPTNTTGTPSTTRA
ncbi:hypothetical protein GCM10015535_64730 [Streptomyces gelaticus]|uniref:Uncharacterized protein n=1 Tax=Streptomyces gelaticus TaxID=285446 RepID=A0ABQ2WAP4_9ACTN|nr:hypothetical protein GCM10015535_64730 [Streptomyces gelaticus]